MKNRYQIIVVACLVLFVTLLFACAPALSTDKITWTRVGDVITITASEGPKLKVGSSEDITAWLPANACQYEYVTAGPLRAISCAAPVEITLNTSGAVSAQLHDEFRPVSPPVLIPVQ